MKTNVPFWLNFCVLAAFADIVTSMFAWGLGAKDISPFYNLGDFGLNTVAIILTHIIVLLAVFVMTGSIYRYKTIPLKITSLIYMLFAINNFIVILELLKIIS